MNCDGVFDALTNPAGGDRAALESHLARCPRCRDLQAMLEPALSALSASLDPDTVSFDRVSASEALPSAEAVALAEQTASRLAAESSAFLERPRTAGRVRRWTVAASRSAALVLLGAFGMLLWTRDAGPARQPAASPSGIRADCTWLRSRDVSTRGQNARSVILACGACHATSAKPQRESIRSTLFRAPRPEGEEPSY